MNYYTEYWDSGDEKRNSEVISCINKNINSGFFKNIFIYSKNIEERINAKTIPLDRITYQFIFDNNIDGINILANSDIEFDETIKLAENIKEEEFYCLTRYEDNGLLHKHNDPYLGSDSQDVWIWKNKSKIQESNFFLGVPGCDNKIAYIAEINGYRVKNPSIDIKTYHRHKTDLRPGSSSNTKIRLMPPYRLVPVSKL